MLRRGDESGSGKLSRSIRLEDDKSNLVQESLQNVLGHEGYLIDRLVLFSKGHRILQ